MMAERVRVPKLLAVVAVIVAVVAAACGGDDDAEPQAGGGGGEVDYGEVKVIFSGDLEDKVPQAGAWRFGPEFGFSEQDVDDIRAVESHATAAQILLAGHADVLEATFIVTAQLVQQGQPVKAFCPEEVDTQEHLVGVGISDLADITNPDIRVGIDSPGGLINYLMNHVFRARGLTNDEGDPLTVDDLENVKILEDGGLRVAALASDEIDVGSLELDDIADLKKQLGDDTDINILSVTAEDIDDAVGSVFMAKTEWIEEDPDRAAAFCASALKSTRTLAGDFETYLEWATEASGLEVEESDLRTNWEFIREHEVWPFDADVLNAEAVATDIDVLIDSGLLEASASELSFEDLVDLGPAEQAVEMLGGPIEDISELEG
jgi:hypothetical protein